MAILWDLNDEAWCAGVNSRPPVVKAIAEKIAPNRLYRLKSTGQRVTLYSISENGTVTVEVTGEYNRVAFDRTVFGIDPADLEECDLPPPDELLGTAFTTEQEVIHAVQPRLAELHLAGKEHNREICELCQQRQ